MARTEPLKPAARRTYADAPDPRVVALQCAARGDQLTRCGRCRSSNNRCEVNGCLGVIPPTQRAQAMALLICLGVTGFAATLHAQTRTAGNTAIDRYVRSEMATRRIPGLALLVTKNHRIVYAANYGVANLELQAPV